MSVEAELPDGTVLEFPDGTSREVMQRVVKARLQSAAKAPAATPVAATPVQTPPDVNTRAGGYGAADAGVAGSTIKGWIGLKDAERAALPGMASLREKLGGASAAEDKAVVNEIKAEEEREPFPKSRAWGGFVGNTGATAGLAPAAGAVYSGVKAGLPGVMKILAAPTSGAVVSGAQGALLEPGTPEEKLAAAKHDAAWGAGLAGTMKALGKTATGLFRPSAEAKSLMSQGVTPTLQQGADSPIGRFIGGLTSGAVDVRNRQNQEVMDALLKRIAPGIDFAEMNVPERVKILSAHFNGEPGGATGAYEAILGGKKFSLTNQARSDIWGAARGPRGTQAGATQLGTQAMSDTGAALNASNPVTMKSGKLREYQNLLDDAVNRFSAEGGVMQGLAKTNLAKARLKFNELVRDPSLSAEELASLKVLDAQYGDFLRFADAASKPGFHVKPRVSQVLQSYSDMAPSKSSFAIAENPTQSELLEPAARTMGLTPNQDEARSLISAIKRAGKIATTGAVAAGAGVGNPLGIALAPAYGISLAGQTGPGARALFGETGKQKALAEYIRKVSPYALGSGFSATGED